MIDSSLWQALEYITRHDLDDLFAFIYNQRTCFSITLYFFISCLYRSSGKDSCATRGFMVEGKASWGGVGKGRV
jgi:hypothetical protein